MPNRHTRDIADSRSMRFQSKRSFCDLRASSAATATGGHVQTPSAAPATQKPGQAENGAPGGGQRRGRSSRARKSV